MRCGRVRLFGVRGKRLTSILLYGNVSANYFLNIYIDNVFLFDI